MQFKGHLSPTLAGKLAAQAGVKKLILTHIYPDTDKLPLRDICATIFDGEIVVAKDFDTFFLQDDAKIIDEKPVTVAVFSAWIGRGDHLAIVAQLVRLFHKHDRTLVFGKRLLLKNHA